MAEVAPRTSSEAIKEFLQKPNSRTGECIYDELVELLLQISVEKPADAVKKFETINANSKLRTFDRMHGRVPELQFTPNPPDIKRAKERCALFQPRSIAVDRNGQRVNNDAAAEYYIPDIVQEVDMFEWAGVGIGREEAFRVMLALRALANDERHLKSVRFWGKIVGTKKDYYVCESELKVEEKIELPPGKPSDPVRRNVQKMNRHNQFKYYVCNYPGDKWTLLPNVLFDQVTSVATMNRLFTGNLDSKVACFPPFNGNESNHLRATIAHISANAVLSPTGYFQIQDAEEDEDGNEIKAAIVPNPEFEGVEQEELLGISSWVAHYPPIPAPDPVPEVPEEEEEEEPAEEEEEPEEEIPDEDLALDPLDAETVEADYWVRQTSLTATQFAPVSVRSRLWPGATAVALGARFSNVYIGLGQRLAPAAFVPPLPPPVCEDKPELAEVDELNEVVDFDDKAEGEEEEEQNEEEEES